MATGLMQIGDRPVTKKEGFVDEERRDGEAVRRETRLKENEKKKTTFNYSALPYIDVHYSNKGKKFYL